MTRRSEPRPAAPAPPLYAEVVRGALAEDLGLGGDITTDSVVPEGAKATARIVARAPGCIAGLPVAVEVFRHLDPSVEARLTRHDGDQVTAGTTLVELEGSARTLLSGERVALNLLGRLSGIATATRRLVDAVGEHHATIACTRKTTPGLRALEKYAVRVGGGRNHRLRLDDAILIKDNHVAFCGGVRSAVERARAVAGHMVKIELEVDTLEQLEEALELGVEVVLLDNMSCDELRRAVAMTAGRAILEASGGIDESTAAAIAATGVDVLSVGALTHSAACLDVALDLVV